MRTVKGISAMTKQPWMAQPDTFTAEVNYVPADDCLQFQLPTGATVALSYSELKTFMASIEAHKDE